LELQSAQSALEEAAEALNDSFWRGVDDFVAEDIERAEEQLARIAWLAMRVGPASRWHCEHDPLVVHTRAVARAWWAQDKAGVSEGKEVLRVFLVGGEQAVRKLRPRRMEEDQALVAEHLRGIMRAGSVKVWEVFEEIGYLTGVGQQMVEEGISAAIARGGCLLDGDGGLHDTKWIMELLEGSAVAPALG
jgi:hypothetical protein